MFVNAGRVYGALNKARQVCDATEVRETTSREAAVSCERPASHELEEKPP